MNHTHNQMAVIYAQCFTNYAFELMAKYPKMSTKQRYDKYKIWALQTFGNMEEAIYFINNFVKIN